MEIINIWVKLLLRHVSDMQSYRIKVSSQLITDLDVYLLVLAHMIQTAMGAEADGQPIEVKLTDQL